MNVHFSDLLSMVLEPLAGSWEVISVNDFISGCEDYNDELENKEKTL